MVVEERHERFEHVGAHVVMELSREGHLRAWLLEEVDSRLTQRSESTLNWAEDLLRGLLKFQDVPGIFREAVCILPQTGLIHFISWSLHDYPN